MNPGFLRLGRMGKVKSFGAAVLTATSLLVASAHAEGLPDFAKLEAIGDLVSVSFGRTIFNRRTKVMTSNAVITNTSAESINCPIALVIKDISVPGVTSLNFDGLTPGTYELFTYGWTPGLPGDSTLVLINEELLDGLIAGGQE